MYRLYGFWADFVCFAENYLATSGGMDSNRFQFKNKQGYPFNFTESYDIMTVTKKSGGILLCLSAVHMSHSF
jgi:hypothetical protein